MASGDTIFTLNAFDFVGAATNGPQDDTRNGHQIKRYDTTTQETSYCPGLTLPSHYSGLGLTADIETTASTATTGTGAWGLSVERNNTDLDADSFASETLSSAVTVDGTAGIPFRITIVITAGANMDNAVSGDPIRLMLRRSVATDSAAGDLELFTMHVKET